MVSRSPSNAATEADPLLEEALQRKFDQAKLEQDNVVHDSPNVTEESFELVKLALPIIATLILEFLPGAFAVAVVGHIDSPLKKEFVDAATLSVMFLNITGLSIGFGLSTAMDTLCSQTVGAGKLYNLGMYFQSGLIVLGSMFIPALIVNYNTEFFLLALGQDPTVAALAGSFSKISVFAMPGVFLYELIKKVLQAQKIVSPMAYIAVLTNLVYFGLGYYLCYETDIGFLGAAYARTISQSLLPIIAYLYLLWNPVYKDWWPADHGFSAQWKAAWDHVPEFFSLGVPGMLMMILEWWAFELCEVIAGWMANPVLSISVQSVLMSLASQAYSVFSGINIATTVRLGNALGANEPNRAHMISNVALGISLAAGVFMSIVFLMTRDILPRAFISDPTSVAAIQHALAIFAVYEIIDCLNNAGQSILKGMGKQSVGAWVNAMAYYVLGIPFGTLLAFHFNLGVEGLWIGLASGLLGAFCLFFWYICRVNWKDIAIEAVTRMSK